jgi:glycosyltransferase involved in cell wall biosynthesis
MKVLHLIDSQGFYGAERIMLDLMCQQMKSGVDTQLLSVGNKDHPPKEVEIEAERRGLPVYTRRFRDGLNPFGSKVILQFAHEQKADLIHSHGYKGNILLGIVPKFVRNIPVVTTVHGWVGIKKFSKFYFYEKLDALCMNNLERVIVVSDSQRLHPNMRLFRLNPGVIHNGIHRLTFHEDVFNSEVKNLCNLVKISESIISIGRISRLKGFDVLIDAVEQLISKKVKVQLVLLGEGRDRRELEKYVREKDLSGSIHFPGYQEDAYRVIPAFKVFVIASYTEGLPLMLLEAMQAGVPIVATAVGEIPQVLENGELGQLVPPGDSWALADAIKRVFDYPDKYKEMAQKARQKALDEYSLERMTRQYLEVYQEVLADDRK